MQLRGVGKAIAKHLERLQITSVQDLLLHLPLRYQDRTRLTPIRRLIVGREALIEGVVVEVETSYRGRTKLLCTITDKTGSLRLRFLYSPFFIKKMLVPGVRVRCYGMVRLSKQGLEMIHPDCRALPAGQSWPLETYLTPIYPTTKGLSQAVLRKLMDQALARMAKENFFQELLPKINISFGEWPTLQEALRWIHRPPHDANLYELLQYKTEPQQRLIIEELLAHRIGLLQVKRAFQAQVSPPPAASTPDFLSPFRAALSYALTGAQERVLADIRHDLSRSYPMLRLLQGEVGSGKTVVAAETMLHVVQHGYQTALMAPTTLLAEQHERALKAWFEPLGLKVVLLSGAMSASSRKIAMQAVASGEAQVVVGTHALFQKDLHFARLGLIVIDEQHRFGVHQRALFREKAFNDHYHPHQLMMTATPIPRTLAMSFYADLDCSIIDEMPKGRQPVITSVIPSHRREEVIQRVQELCLSGQQVYWVCPLIEESELTDAHAAVDMSQTLQQSLKNLNVALLHGKMRTQEKEAIMRAFQAGDIQVLVATTVIEVGIDVKNASLMIIENAERLGLAQLHQLRGRVGRGTVQSYCVLLYDPPLSPVSEARLRVMRETQDGFKIAEEDLVLRGPGEVFGTQQTGEWALQVADLLRDQHHLHTVNTLAVQLVQEQGEIAESLVERWLGKKKIYREI